MSMKYLSGNSQQQQESGVHARSCRQCIEVVEYETDSDIEKEDDDDDDDDEEDDDDDDDHGGDDDHEELVEDDETLPESRRGKKKSVKYFTRKIISMLDFHMQYVLQMRGDAMRPIGHRD